MDSGLKILIAYSIVNLLYLAIAVIDFIALKKWASQRNNSGTAETILTTRRLRALIVLLVMTVISGLAFSLWISEETGIWVKLSYALFFFLPFPYSMFLLISLGVLIKCALGKKHNKS